MDNSIKVSTGMSITLKDQSSFNLMRYMGPGKGWRAVEVGEVIPFEGKQYEVISINQKEIKLRLTEEKHDGQNL